MKHAGCVNRPLPQSLSSTDSWLEPVSQALGSRLWRLHSQSLSPTTNQNDNTVFTGEHDLCLNTAHGDSSSNRIRSPILTRTEIYHVLAFTTFTGQHDPGAKTAHGDSRSNIVQSPTLASDGSDDVQTAAFMGEHEPGVTQARGDSSSNRIRSPKN